MYVCSLCCVAWTRYKAPELGGADEYGSEMQAIPRNYVIEELRDTEETYIKLLDVLLDIYAPTLKAMPDDVSDDAYTAIFGNLDDIRAIHRDFFRRLKVR